MSSTTSSYPPLPPLGALRPARVQDIPRLAVIATAGFYCASLFPHERRFHADFPTDTFLSYQKTFANLINNPEHIVLVAEDAYDPHEADKLEATIVPDLPIKLPEPGETIIVGVVAWKLSSGSIRVGQFSTKDVLPPNIRIDGGPGRDRNWTFSNAARNAIIRCTEANFPSDSYQELELMVVHPAYWARGHASRLVRWGLALADLDGMKQGVLSASASGIKLYLKLEFEQVDEFVLHNDAMEPPKELKVCAFTYTPSSLRQHHDPSQAGKGLASSESRSPSEAE